MTMWMLVACLRGLQDGEPEVGEPEGASPQILVEPARLELGMAGWSLERQLTVMNTGDATLRVVDVVDGAPFTVDFEGPLALEPGELSLLPVLYEADDYGVFEGELQLQSNDPLEPLVVVPASATNPWPELSAPGLLDFGATGVRCEEELSFTLENVGLAPLTISDVELSSDSTELYVQDKNLPWTLEPGQTKELKAWYEPHDEGTDDAEVRFQSNDPKSPLKTMYLLGSATWEDAC